MAMLRGWRRWTTRTIFVVSAAAPFSVVAMGGCQPAASQRTAQPPEETPANPAQKAAQVAADELPAPAIKPATGPELYVQHCATCHGEKGDGQGIAARILFPKPRDFTAGRFRLISTMNGVPTDEDLTAVLVRGMPGSSMPSWGHLGKGQIQLLVDEVKRLRQAGLREDMIRRLVEQDEEVDEADIDDTVATLTEPGDVPDMPEVAAADADSVARGKEVYIKQSCHSCHGQTGRGDGAQVMVDAEGLPTKPRDFTRGVFKGGYDPSSLYHRIYLGMPGTPMPSSRGTLQPEQIVDLVNFIRSLSDEETRAAQTLKRETLAVKQVSKLPESEDPEAWASVPATPIRTMPLWWRDDAHPDLRVQAVHDGKTIAVRLQWSDATADLDSARTEAFKDAAAVALYRGNAEPFLGMGGKSGPVDLWMWDACHQAGPKAVEEEYPNAVVDIYPFHEKIVETAEFSREGARLVNQPPISLPAVATGNQIAITQSSRPASSLGAIGPGSTTFHLPKNQDVDAHGTYRDGQWTVILKRPLKVASDGVGVSLAPGQTASISFGIWNGAKGDRNGQKLVSIWQDLKLE
jgi:DMSO reductase family type II enzyme heme b subunit